MSGLSVQQALLRCADTGRAGMLLQRLAHHRRLMAQADHAVHQYIESDGHPTPEQWLEMWAAERAAKKMLLARLIAGVWLATAVWNGGKRRQSVPAGWWVGVEIDPETDEAKGNLSRLTGVRIIVDGGGRPTMAAVRSAKPSVRQEEIVAWMTAKQENELEERGILIKARVLHAMAGLPVAEGGLNCNRPSARCAFGKLPEELRNGTGRSAKKRAP